MTNKTVQEQLDVIRRGTVEIISEAELAKKIECSLQTKKPLVIKAGFDPSAPDLHLGHTILLRKLRDFHRLGHEINFLIGDFTALIGDPSGQKKTRPILTHEQIAANTATYLRQVEKILGEQDHRIQIRYNSKWFSSMKLELALVELASKYTVAQLIERDDFSKRYKENRPITMSEMFYPLMQGYDSVALRADVELGGTDQKFNLLVGREFQKTTTPPQEPQVVITLPLLEGTDGVNKMSKSLGNAIGIQEDSNEMFGKLMAISDEVMLRYYELLTDVDVVKVKSEIKNGKNPKLAKEELAFSITKDFHSEAKAREALAEFQKVFQQKGAPADVPLFAIHPGADGKVDVIKLLFDSALASSMTEARRLLEQGSVKLNHSSRIQQRFVHLNENDILQVGPRKFVKILIYFNPLGAQHDEI